MNKHTDGKSNMNEWHFQNEETWNKQKYGNISKKRNKNRFIKINNLVSVKQDGINF